MMHICEKDKRRIRGIRREKRVYGSALDGMQALNLGSDAGFECILGTLRHAYIST